MKPAAEAGRTVLGIDVGGTKIAAAVVRQTGEVVASVTVPTPRASDAAILDRLEEVTAELLQAPGARAQAIGVGLPGIVDASAGVAVSAANVPWAHTRVADRLRGRFGLATHIENDANAATLGEKWFGQGRGVERFAYVSIGTGVGSGIVAGGRLLQGRAGHGSELGHMIVAIGGPVCGCGSRGCLETLAAGPSLGRRMQERYGRALSGQEVFAAAAAGDGQAQAVLEEAVTYLAIGVINLWRLITPELVILGGGVAGAGDQLLTPLRTAVTTLAPHDGQIAASLTLSSLDGSSGVLGAAALALEEAG